MRLSEAMLMTFAKTYGALLLSRRSYHQPYADFYYKNQRRFWDENDLRGAAHKELRLTRSNNAAVGKYAAFDVE
jgi:hypothetical protein